MQRFARLFSELDQTNKTNDKIQVMSEYFRDSDPESAAWGLYFLCGQKLQRIVTSTLLRQWAVELANIEDWLFDECYEAVGDLAETISLVLPKNRVDSASTLLNQPGSETAAIDTTNWTLAEWVHERLLPLKRKTVAEQQIDIIRSWRSLDQTSCLVLNKLLTGSFRVGVSQRLVVRGLSLATGIQVEVLAHRLMGSWKPTAEFYQSLLQTDATDTEVSRPYPFFLAHSLECELAELGSIDQWQAEWKWDGIRAQIIRRSGQTFIWSRGEELMNERFPELERTAPYLPDGTVLDGEIVGYRDNVILPFAQLQRRIGRKELGKKILHEVPVAFLVFDLLEHRHEDCRGLPLRERRQRLKEMILSLKSGPLERSSDSTTAQSPDRTYTHDVSTPTIRDASGQSPQSETIGEDMIRDQAATSSSQSPAPNPLVQQTSFAWAAEEPIEPAHEQTHSLPLDAVWAAFLLPALVHASDWTSLAELRQSSRAASAEGLMLKRLDSPYRVGRPRGDWWKWKIEPFTVDAVLIYAQRGHGKRASLYTDYTFGVWDADRLVPFAKAYSGLTDKEIAQVDSFVRKHTIERFGPVRSVKPELVFELAFENIQLSTRHKSGIAVRFPRILRWRTDKRIDQADSIEAIRSMLSGLKA